MIGYKINDIFFTEKFLMNYKTDILVNEHKSKRLLIKLYLKNIDNLMNILTYSTILFTSKDYKKSKVKKISNFVGFERIKRVIRHYYNL